MIKLLKITAHAIGAAVSGLVGILLAGLAMALIPGGGPYGPTWLFGMEIALFFVLPPLGAFGYLWGVSPKQRTTSNSTAEPDARNSGARGSL